MGLLKKSNKKVTSDFADEFIFLGIIWTAFDNDIYSHLDWEEDAKYRKQTKYLNDHRHILNLAEFSDWLKSMCDILIDSYYFELTAVVAFDYAYMIDIYGRTPIIQRVGGMINKVYGPSELKARVEFNCKTNAIDGLMKRLIFEQMQVY